MNKGILDLVRRKALEWLWWLKTLVEGHLHGVLKDTARQNRFAVNEIDQIDGGDCVVCGKFLDGRLRIAVRW
jgi:hypothetical protein